MRISRCPRQLPSAPADERRAIILAFAKFLERVMGKGDVRGRRGKIFNHSYGKKRLHKKKKAKAAAAAKGAV